MKTLIKQVALLGLTFLSFPSHRILASQEEQQQDSAASSPLSYGVDVSFPIHNAKVSTNYPWLPHNVHADTHPTPSEYKDMPIQPLGNVQERYDEFIKGCHEYYPRFARSCDITESDRIAMSLRQPASMQNYTQVGFQKIKTPPAVWKLISEFWEANKDKQNWSPENWGKGNTYTNHWAAPTYMVDVGNGGLRGGGYRLKNAIWDAARSTLQEWTGEELTQCSLYGIRVYTGGSILATHVDRLPLVTSAIVNVAQDVEEPWPLEVYSHDGKAYNVTMEPGDMVLYESHSVLHGRPFPMKGNYYANIFIHFEPTGHSLRHNAKFEGGVDVDEQYRESVSRGQGGHENFHDGLPSYIKVGSDEEIRWRRSHPSPQKAYTGQTEAHSAAAMGDLESLIKIIEKKKDMVHKKDVNGWTPIHEAARGGHVEVVRTLVERGADVNQVTGLTGEGGQSVLHLAIEHHGEDHPLVDYLMSLGAMSVGPEL